MFCALHARTPTPGLCRPLQTSLVDTQYCRPMMLAHFEAAAAACSILPLLHGYIGMSATMSHCRIESLARRTQSQ